MKAIVLTLVSLSFFVSCLPRGSEDNVHLSKVVVRTNVIDIENNSNLNAQQKADLIAQEAEKLMTASGFMYASELVNKALTYDATSFRAQLLYAILAPEIKTQGLLKRMESIFLNTKSGRNLREKIGQVLGRNDSLKSFLNDSKKVDIKNENDLQALLKEIQQEKENLRSFISKNKDKRITLSVPVVSSKNKIRTKISIDYNKGTEEVIEVKKALDTDENDLDVMSDGIHMYTNVGYMKSLAYTYCTTRISNNGEYETVCHESIDYVQKFITLVKPDFEVAEQVAAAAVIQMLIGNSYNYEGAIRVLEEMTDQDTSPLAKSIHKQKEDHYNDPYRYSYGVTPSYKVFASKSALELIKEKPNLGKGLNLKDLEYINTLGANAIPAVRLALQNQRRLCPTGSLESKQREGYMMSSGLCLSNTLAGDIISSIEDGLSGRDSEFKVHNNVVQKTVNMSVNVQKFITGSLNDLQSVGASYGDDGRLRFEDQTASGVVTSGNLNEVLNTLSETQNYYMIEKENQ